MNFVFLTETPNPPQNSHEHPPTLEDMLSDPNADPTEPDPEEEDDEEYARKLYAAVGGDSFFKPRLPNVKKYTVIILERDKAMDRLQKKIRRTYNKKVLQMEVKPSLVKPKETLCRQISTIPSISPKVSVPNVRNVLPGCTDMQKENKQLLSGIMADANLFQAKLAEWNVLDTNKFPKTSNLVALDEFPTCDCPAPKTDQRSRFASVPNGNDNVGHPVEVEGGDKGHLSEESSSSEINPIKSSVEQHELTVDVTTGGVFELGEQSRVHTTTDNAGNESMGKKQYEDPPFVPDKALVKKKVSSMNEETRDYFRAVLRSLRHLSLDRAMELARQHVDDILNPIEKLISRLKLNASYFANRRRGKK